ncbi:hypothetical protein [Xanthomonas campestris]|uniref:hypothetical protein n=1 Tax=Xanthomonas campestris TaxID=339 RepID=UPI0023EA34F0|nr:hypothetical protein [Xanthomonas campestris]
MISGNLRLAVVLLVALSACAAPGQGTKAKKNQKIGDDIVRSIEGYRVARATYPRSIDALEDYQEIIAAAESGKIKTFFNSNSHDHYELIIKYFGPGSNSCVHRSADIKGDWNCTGGY